MLHDPCVAEHNDQLAAFRSFQAVDPSSTLPVRHDIEMAADIEEPILGANKACRRKCDGLDGVYWNLTSRIDDPQNVFTEDASS